MGYAKKWVNDYGDIPRWYWGPFRYGLHPPRKRISPHFLSTIFGLAAGL